MCILFQYYYLIFGSQKKISANTIIKNLLIKKKENGDVFLYSDVMSDNIKISVYLKCNKNGLENANGIIGASNFLPPYSLNLCVRSHQMKIHTEFRESGIITP